MTQFLGFVTSVNLNVSSAEGTGGLFARSTPNGQSASSNNDGGESAFSSFLEAGTAQGAIGTPDNVTDVSQIALQRSAQTSIDFNNLAQGSFAEEFTADVVDLPLSSFETEPTTQQIPFSQNDLRNDLINLETVEEGLIENSQTPSLLPLRDAEIPNNGFVRTEGSSSRLLTLTSLSDPEGEIFAALQAEGIPAQQQENAVLLPLEINIEAVPDDFDGLITETTNNRSTFAPTLAFPTEFQNQITRILETTTQILDNQEGLSSPLNNLESIEPTVLLSQLSNANSLDAFNLDSNAANNSFDALSTPLTTREREAFFNQFAQELGLEGLNSVSVEDVFNFNLGAFNLDANGTIDAVLPETQVLLSSNPFNISSPVEGSEANGTQGVFPDPLLTAPANGAESLLDGEGLSTSTSQQELSDDQAEPLSRNDNEGSGTRLETESLVVLPLVGAVNVSQRSGFETLVETPQNRPIVNDGVENALLQSSSILQTGQIEQANLEVNLKAGLKGDDTLSELGISDNVRAAPISDNSDGQRQQTPNLDATFNIQQDPAAQNPVTGDTLETLIPVSSSINSESQLDIRDTLEGIDSTTETDVVAASSTPVNTQTLALNPAATTESLSQNTFSTRPVEQSILNQAATAPSSAAPLNTNATPLELTQGQSDSLGNLAGAILRSNTGPSLEGVPSNNTLPVNNSVNAASLLTGQNNNSFSDQQGRNLANQQGGNPLAANQSGNEAELTRHLNNLANEQGSENRSFQQLAQSSTQNLAQNALTGEAFTGARQISKILGQSLTDGLPISQITPQGLSIQQPSLSSNLQPQIQFSASSLPDQTLPSLSAQIARNSAGGQNGFTIQLNPSELGRVDVRLISGEDGTLTARIQVEQAETLDLFQRDVRGLERALQQSGLRLSEAGIDLSLRDNGSQNNNGNANQQNASGEAGEHNNSRNNRDDQQNPNKNNLTPSNRLLVDDIASEVPDALVKTLYAGFSSGQLNIEV